MYFHGLHGFRGQDFLNPQNHLIFMMTIFQVSLEEVLEALEAADFQGVAVALAVEEQAAAGNL